MTTIWNVRRNTLGVVNENTEDLQIIFRSSAKTSDFIVNSLYGW